MSVSPAPQPLASRTVAVTTAGDAFSLELACGLADAGGAIALLGACDESLRAASRIEQAGGRATAVPRAETPEGPEESLRAAAKALGAIDVVVHARIDERALEALPLAELDDAGWDRCCEAEIRSALYVARAAHRVLERRDGRLLFVTPTLSHSGAAQHVAYAAACESIRALAKSLARAWGPLGITVNCIAPDVESLMAVDPLRASQRAAAARALGRTADVRRDIAPVAAALVGPGAHFVTGETVRVDGGAWLA